MDFGKPFHRIKSITLLLFLIPVLFFLPAFSPAAQGESKTVRVGWYDSSYNTMDSSGRRTGYAYEYQLKIAAYTDWSYEYVKGSWADLMHMLLNGKIDLTTDEDVSLQMLKTGELDAYVTEDAFTDPGKAKPVCKVGSSDYYFAVSGNRPDLFADLNNAMSKIQDENRFFNSEMYERFIHTAGNNAFLASEELD